MFEYATRSELHGFASKVSLAEQATLRKAAEDRSPQGSTFLSHSSKDDKLVSGSISVLKGHGATVYIDKKDPALPPYTNKNTALTLKTRIKQSSKFVLLATKNSKESKWVPWELGLADGYKGLSKIALFPAVEGHDDTAWTSWEYMGLYNRIVWGDLEGHDKQLWMVLNEKENTATSLLNWLKNS